MQIDRDDPHLSAERRAAPRVRPGLVLVMAVVTALISTAVCVVAVAAPASVAALPLVVLICVGGPIFATWEASAAFSRFRADRAHRHGVRAMASLRSTLDKLPEVEHPLGH